MPEHGRRRLLVPSVLASVATMLCAFDASASDERMTATLAYTNNVAARCPDDESFRHRVAARLGYQPFASTGDHRVSVRLRVASGRVHGHAEVMRAGQSSPGVRDLDSPIEECESLVSALAVAVAIALDPVRSAGPPLEEPSPATDLSFPESSRPPEPPLVGSPPQDSLVRDAPTRESPLRFFGAASAAGSAGLLPGPSIGAAVGGGLRGEVISVEIAGRAETMPSAVRVDSGDRVEATTFSALLAACAHLNRWSACGVGRAGAIQGRAPDVVAPTLGSSLFGTAGVRVGYELPLSSLLTLRALASAEVPLVRTALVVSGSGVWTAPLATAGGEIGVVVYVP